ncbi:hypothetical protein PIB30_009764 [Stylosanthes scabra]|uniref:Uncharacterized protein n=1 Tax=Stylosanthes scabra TaxID=79078 RepID=A0ABU6X4T8_9FABA|nr:hypothetical protein [Stylosanthes scabra]
MASETPYVNVGHRTSECNGLLLELQQFLLVKVKRLSIFPSQLISPISRVHDCLKNLLSLKEKRAADHEEYQWQQMKNKTVAKVNLIERLAFSLSWYLLLLYYSRKLQTMQKCRYVKLQDATNNNKHKPQVTAQHISSYAISATMFLWIFSMHCHTLLEKYLATKARDTAFIVAVMLALLSFMVLVWALCVKILVGGKLSLMNSALFLLWAILKLFNSDNSIHAVCLPLLGIFFIGWHAMEGKKLLSTSIRNRIHDALEPLRILSTLYRKRVGDYDLCQWLNEEKIIHKGDSMEAADRKMTRQVLAVGTTSYLDILMEETKGRFSYELYNAINKHKPQVTAQSMSSYAISGSMFLWIFLIYDQTLLAKYFATKARVSAFIVAEMLGLLLSFMVLVWALCVKILVGGKLSRMNCVLFLLWAILKLFNSDNSIDAVYLPILGIFFIGWHAMSSPENKNQMEGKKLLSTSIVKEFC